MVVSCLSRYCHGWSWPVLLFWAIVTPVVRPPGLVQGEGCEATPPKERYTALLAHLGNDAAQKQCIIDIDDVTTICGNDVIPKPRLEKEPQVWYKVPDRNVYVFSAFYEGRALADGPAVRIVGSGLQAQFNDVGDLYCHLWYRNKPYPAVVGPALYHRIYPSLGHPDHWVSHFIICKLPRPLSGDVLPVPYAVSVVPEPCLPHGDHLMVLNRQPVARKGQHGVCISPLYGRLKNWTMVAEMLELHKLLGAEAITIYQYSVHPHTERLLASYHQDNTSGVKVVMWNTYPRVRSSLWCQRGALNDCLYRMGQHYRYVSIVDLDEVLVPRVVPSIPLLMKHIARPGVGAYLFQHAYFRRNSSREEELISQTSFWRTDVVTPAGKVRSKAMYLAEATVSIDIHSPYLLIEGSREYILEPEEGMLHHYRAAPMESFIKRPQNYRFIEDRYMEQYKAQLTEKLKPKFKAAKGGS